MSILAIKKTRIMEIYLKQFFDSREIYLCFLYKLIMCFQIHYNPTSLITNVDPVGGVCTVWKWDIFSIFRRNMLPPFSGSRWVRVKNTYW